MARHEEKLAESIRQIAAAFIGKETDRGALVTVTGVRLTGDHGKAEILITVLPQDKEKDELNHLKSRRAAFWRHAADHMRTRRLPALDFELDRGEKNRRRLDELSGSL